MRIEQTALKGRLEDNGFKPFADEVTRYVRPEFDNPEVVLGEIAFGPNSEGIADRHALMTDSVRGILSVHRFVGLSPVDGDDQAQVEISMGYEIWGSQPLDKTMEKHPDLAIEGHTVAYGPPWDPYGYHKVVGQTDFRVLEPHPIMEGAHPESPGWDSYADLFWDTEPTRQSILQDLLNENPFLIEVESSYGVLRVLPQLLALYPDHEELRSILGDEEAEEFLTELYQPDDQVFSEIEEYLRTHGRFTVVSDSASSEEA